MNVSNERAWYAVEQTLHIIQYCKRTLKKKLIVVTFTYPNTVFVTTTKFVIQILGQYDRKTTLKGHIKLRQACVMSHMSHVTDAP